MSSQDTARTSTERAPRARTATAVTVVLGLTLSNLSIFATQIEALGPYVGRDVFWWALTLLVVLYVKRIERRPLSSIGLKRPTRITFIGAIIGAAVLIAISLAVGFVLFPVLGLTQPPGLAERVAWPFWARILLTTRAAVAEEVIFRGFAIERIEWLTGKRSVALVLSTIVFTFAHLGSWGWSTQLWFAALGGLVFGSVYLWKRDLTLNVVMHFLADSAAFLAR